MVMPNMLWGGKAHYASDLMPRSETFQKLGDQIAQCVAAAHKHGLEVHVWKVELQPVHGPAGVCREDAAGAGGPRSRPRESRSTGSARPIRRTSSWSWRACWRWSRKYDVDGLQFDDIRYPDEGTATATAAASGSRRRAAVR